MYRRSFIQFLGLSSTGIMVAPQLVACSNNQDDDKKSSVIDKPQQINGITPSNIDDVILADGLSYQILITWGELINSTEKFGFNNDFTCFLQESDSEGVLWVNHEYIDPRFISGEDWASRRDKETIEKEMLEVGGSFIHLKKINNNWIFDAENPDNKRITGLTKIPFNWDEKIQNQSFAIGTLANCSGGKTPWGTILTCEENYDSFYGERQEDNSISQSDTQWEKIFPFPPEHYGWVVEVNPHNFETKKHVALGRFAHECACLTQLNDGRIVVYSGDDAKNEHLYKFIGSEPNSLKEGKLYVANIETQSWISLDWNDQEVLKEHFANQTEVLTYCRKAAKLVGATPLDRPEDIEIDPISGNIFIALTNNQPKGNYYGSILKIQENNKEYDSLNFKSEVFLAGGEETGFACPDNLMFDKKGNLWFTSDISGKDMNKNEYESFGNNGLFVALRSGNQAGEVIQIASAPTDAEFTGPYLTDNEDTLFLSVQHPGEYSESIHKLSSNWPDKKSNSIPKSSVITIQGELLHLITKG